MTEVKDSCPDDPTRQQFPHIDADPATLPATLDPFTITTSTGFMPLRTPRIDLPADFEVLQKLAEDLPVTKADGSPGLLATYDLGPTIDKGALPDLTDAIDDLVLPDGQSNLEDVTAAFREYAFLASAYLLEPCWERYDKGLEGYGLGRQTLPRCIAGPLTKTAKMYGQPLMTLKHPMLIKYQAQHSPFHVVRRGLLPLQLSLRRSFRRHIGVFELASHQGFREGP